MKVSPFVSDAPKTANLNEGHSYSSERMARAKAIATGQTPASPDAPATASPPAEQLSLKKIKMKTQMSQNRHQLVEAPAIAPVEASTEKTPQVEGDTLANNEQANVASEDTKPLSPQFAALARQKRELQIKEKDLQTREAALATKMAPDLSGYVSKADIQANALKVALENGVTYDMLTEQILAQNNSSVDLSGVESKIKALEESFDKRLTDRDAQVEQQVVSQITRDVDQLIATGDEYETIREAGYGPKVVELIHKVYKTKGQLLDITVAANAIEQEALEDALKWAKIKKVQSRLNPAPTQQTQPVQQDRNNTKIMRTLTNRDGVSSTTMSKRERAIAAMEGRLK